MTSKCVTIVNPSGLHARPASEFVAAAKQYTSKITIRNAEEAPDTAVNAKSIVMLLTLGLGAGCKAEIAASGDDEQAAVDALVTLIASGFGE